MGIADWWPYFATGMLVGAFVQAIGSLLLVHHLFTWVEKRIPAARAGEGEE